MGGEPTGTPCSIELVLSGCVMEQMSYGTTDSVGRVCSSSVRGLGTGAFPRGVVTSHVVDSPVLN